MSTTVQTILVIEDDENVRETIGVVLEQDGFLPIFAADGKSGIVKAVAMKAQLLLVDLRLPRMSGTELCKQLRAAGNRTPLIVVSAVGEELDKVLLLEMGADDYIVKPFGKQELLARIKALLRRTTSDTILRFGDIDIDVDRKTASRRGHDIPLSPAEFNLLLYFLKNPDQSLSRDVILNSVWGFDSCLKTRTVDAYVVRLRQKFEPDATVPQHFITVHGAGYRFLL